MLRYLQEVEQKRSEKESIHADRVVYEIAPLDQDGRLLWLLPTEGGKGMKQRIKISQRNIGDLWRLPCVQGLAKTLDGKMMVAIGPQAVEQLAYEGDWIVQNDDDTWSVQKGGEK